MTHVKGYLCRLAPKPCFRTGRLIALLGLFWLLCLPGGQALPADAPDFSDMAVLENLEVHGFVETRAGIRSRRDEDESRASVEDARVQVDLFTFTDSLDFKFKTDVLADGISDKAGLEPREAWVFTRALGRADLKAGRQVLTWGTGDLVFLNDLFPKDWQSFFIGRDAEYLKAPSDAIKLSLFSDLAGLDLVYTPVFDPDRYITGEYISHWDGTRISGQSGICAASRPNQWFRDHELALRLHKSIESWELALYGYHGFWKTPSGSDASGTPVYPRLNVYGASIRGPVGSGIGNLEIAWYDSRQDRAGTDPLTDNSQLRYLAGYARDLGGDLTASLQYYMEQIMDYDGYEAGLAGTQAKDEFRHVLTLQVTQLLLGQTLNLTLSGYICPSDGDAYIKPCGILRYTDRLTFEAGANLFLGEESHTFFGQFEDNTNVYAAVRYYY